MCESMELWILYNHDLYQETIKSAKTTEATDNCLLGHCNEYGGYFTIMSFTNCAKAIDSEKQLTQHVNRITTYLQHTYKSMMKAG